MDKPFVTIKHAGKVRINDNQTGGRPLAEVDTVDDELEILRNSGAKPDIDTHKGWSSKFLEHPIISAIIAGIVVALILAVLGVSGNFPF